MVRKVAISCIFNSGYSIFNISIYSNVTGFAEMGYHSPPFLRTFVPVDSAMTTGVVPVCSPILSILLACSFSQIDYPVVQPITVDVVDVVLGHVTVDV